MKVHALEGGHLGVWGEACAKELANRTKPVPLTLDNSSEKEKKHPLKKKYK